MVIILIGVILGYVFLYRANKNKDVYKYVSGNVVNIYDKYAPYSFKQIREKVKDLGLDYSPKQFAFQVVLLSGGAFLIAYLYFYDLIIAILYSILSTLFIPYLSYLRYKRIYSEFIFEQIQTYTTNTIMEFQITKAFVKALEGVYSSGVLEDPVLTDVKKMIDLSYANGTIEEALTYFNNKYPFYIVKNMHQLFLQITNEGAHDTEDALDSMLSDIDMLVESVYRDRLDRKQFHQQFLQFGMMLYLIVMLLQFLIGIDRYILMVKGLIPQIILHLIILFNSFFLLKGEKYYNENVGAE